jgi:hypothetical protein
LLGCTAGTPIEIWFQDEARVGQKGSLTYVWAPVGSRPAMVRDNRHNSAYLFGAICPARGVGELRPKLGDGGLRKAAYRGG